MAEEATYLLRELPSIDRLLNHPRCKALLSRYNREYVTRRCRETLEQVRADLRQRNGRARQPDLRAAGPLAAGPGGPSRRAAAADRPSPGVRRVLPGRLGAGRGGR